MGRRRAGSVATAPYSSFGFSPIAPFDRWGERTSRRNVEVEELLKWAVQSEQHLAVRPLKIMD